MGHAVDTVLHGVHHLALWVAAIILGTVAGSIPGFSHPVFDPAAIIVYGIPAAFVGCVAGFGCAAAASAQVYKGRYAAAWAVSLAGAPVVGAAAGALLTYVLSHVW